MEVKMNKIFVDGQAGTTGLVINERLKAYKNIEILTIDDSKRKDPVEKKKILNEADIVFLCLPDEAAKESVALIDNPRTKVIDASTAHRIHPEWSYGIPELSKSHRESIITSTRVANPGCHATAFILPIYPLIQMGLLSKETAISCHSLTGYSGGGKALIEKYENEDINNPYKLKGPRHYALNLNHKHLPEMQVHSGLLIEPNFVPIVADIYKGLVVSIPLHMSQLSKKTSGFEIQQRLEAYYKDSYFVKVKAYQDESDLFDGAFDVTGSNDTNNCDIFVFSNEEKGTINLMSRLDNLGKGASGAALQNMNIMLGLDEWLHLV